MGEKKNALLSEGARHNEQYEGIVWVEKTKDDCQMWCYAGGRRFLFANILIKPKEGTYFGAIYDIDCDDLQIDLGPLDASILEYINPKIPT